MYALVPRAPTTGNILAAMRSAAAPLLGYSLLGTWLVEHRRQRRAGCLCTYSLLRWMWWVNLKWIWWMVFVSVETWNFPYRRFYRSRNQRDGRGGGRNDLLLRCAVDAIRCISYCNWNKFVETQSWHVVIVWSSECERRCIVIHSSNEFPILNWDNCFSTLDQVHSEAKTLNHLIQRLCFCHFQPIGSPFTRFSREFTIPTKTNRTEIKTWICCDADIRHRHHVCTNTAIKAKIGSKQQQKPDVHRIVEQHCKHINTSNWNV